MTGEGKLDAGLYYDFWDAGVNIGNNVVIAAEAVVTKDISNDCLVGGVPVKR